MSPFSKLESTSTEAVSSLPAPSKTRSLYLLRRARLGTRSRCVLEPSTFIPVEFLVSILNGFRYLLLQFLDKILVEFGISEMNELVSHRFSASIDVSEARKNGSNNLQAENGRFARIKSSF
jgi:hypothetical protein